jgi:hypothetical protein
MVVPLRLFNMQKLLAGGCSGPQEGLKIWGVRGINPRPFEGEDLASMKG